MVCKTVNVQLQGQRVKGYRRGTGAGGGRTVPGVFQRSFDPQTERERDRQTEDRIMNGIRTGYVPNESHTY